MIPQIYILTIRCNAGTIIWFTNYNSNLGTWDFKRDFKKYSNQIIIIPHIFYI